MTRSADESREPGSAWHARHVNELCRARGVPRAVYDFIAHNLGHRAAEAALRALPMSGQLVTP